MPDILDAATNEPRPWPPGVLEVASRLQELGLVESPGRARAFATSLVDAAAPFIAEQARRQAAEEIAFAIIGRRCDFNACSACMCRREDAQVALTAAGSVRAPLVSLDELRGEDVTEEDAEALRAHRSDQCEAEQALRRVVDLARHLGDVLPVTADDIAAAILDLDRRTYRPGEPMALLNRQWGATP
ncbi:hypothetical protein AB0395_45575 [Streptosporangium sp. NPDC051023]|uniref:hypothetical protein n=1 Tax=Streptosporangium sp. NPDC051023 TaxID=3155410 RepID=UPI00344BEA27